MVNNSTNVNKTSSDFTLTHSIQKWPWHMTLEILVLVWARHKYEAGLNRLMVIFKNFWHASFEFFVISISLRPRSPHDVINIVIIYVCNR